MFEVLGIGKRHFLTKQQTETPQKPGPGNSDKNEEKNNNQLNMDMDANKRLALYVCTLSIFLSQRSLWSQMPYISWMDWPENKGDSNSRAKQMKEVDQGAKDGAKEPGGGFSKTTSQKLTGSNENDTNYETEKPNEDTTTTKPNVGPIVHHFMTLDQYYYASLHDTTTRDNDQVLGRYTKRKREEQKKNEKKQREEIKESKKEETESNDGEKDEEQTTKILTVNQLWLWILDESMVDKPSL